MLFLKLRELRCGKAILFKVTQLTSGGDKMLTWAFQLQSQNSLHHNMMSDLLPWRQQIFFNYRYMNNYIYKLDNLKYK